MPNLPSFLSPIRRRLLAPIPALLLLAACGGGGNRENPPPPSTFEVTVALSGDGRVTSTPAAIDCGSSCSARFDAASSVTLTAAAASGRVFGGWGGDCTGTNPTCTLTVDAARTVTATFSAPPPTSFRLDVTVSGNGSVGSQPAGIDCGSICSASFAADSSVLLTPTPAAGHAFSAWGGACTGSGPTCTVTMSQVRSVSASFTAVAPVRYLLSVNVAGNGSVRSQPAGIDCGSACSAEFDSGASVLLTATPGNGQLFGGWSGACSGSAATCTVPMTQARSAGATFAAAPAAPAWQAAQRLESSDDFNVAGTNTFSDAHVLAATGPNGHAMVLWEQSDGTPSGDTRKVFSRRYLAGQGWSAAQVVPNLSTDSSSIALVQGRLLVDADGTATWIRPDMETRRHTLAGGWGAPFAPPANSGGSLSAAVMDASGAIGVLVSGRDVYNNALPADGSWGSWARVDTSGSLTAERADVALSRNGSAVAVWRERNPGDSAFSLKAARYTPATGWQAPQTIEAGFDSVTDVSLPRVAIDDAGNAIALWHQGSSVWFNVFSAATASWGSATEVDAGRVNAGFSARLALAMTPDGRAIATWNSGLYALKVMRFTPGAGFSAPETVAPYSIDLGLGLDDNGNAVLLYRSPDRWPNPTSGALNLYSRRSAWGGSWSEAVAIETQAGSTKGNVAAAFNRSGRGVAAWAQNDSATSEIRNSLWANVLE